jgi:hypothetical protein
MVAGAGPAGARAESTGPTVKLIAAQKSVTVDSYGGVVYMDPGIYVASFGQALVFHVQRPSYAKPVTISQILRTGGRTVTRRLPDSVVRDGWIGLRDFIRLRVTNAAGKVVNSSRQPFCPNGYDPERATPDSALNSPYPEQCSAFDPFQKAMAWGIARGWAVDQIAFYGKIKPGRYEVTEMITHRYQRLLHIAAANAKVTVKVTVVKQEGCCGTRQARPRPLRRLARAGSLRPEPAVPALRHPPLAALPDLVPLPSWGISTTSTHPKKGPVTDYLDFGATVWIGGHSPLDVEGFRSHGSATMKAYQYFWRNGRLIGRTRVGTMGFAGYNHWHFRQFAQYRLLTAGKKLALRSHKEGFCIAPTDPIDLLLPRALWQPSSIGLFGECGSPSALWVREMLPIGWGDTYFQSVPGEAFNITRIPNGTYYIEIIANPLRLLHETNIGNDISLRKVILGGTLGHRTVRVPAIHGIDPEHMRSGK